MGSEIHLEKEVGTTLLSHDNIIPTTHRNFVTVDRDYLIMYGYDEAETLVYQREDTSFTDEDGKLNVTISYDFYNLDYNFDLAFDPMDPENGGDIQSINGSILKNVNGTETVEDFTWENVGIRGETGIWYAGVCSCRNGVIGAYEVQ